MADWAFWLFRRKDNTELGDLRDRNRSVKYATKEGDTVTSDLATVLFAEVQSSFGASILTSIVYSLLGSDRVANSLPRPLGLPGRSPVRRDFLRRVRGVGFPLSRWRPRAAPGALDLCAPVHCLASSRLACVSRGRERDPRTTGSPAVRRVPDASGSRRDRPTDRLLGLDRVCSSVCGPKNVTPVRSSRLRGPGFRGCFPSRSEAKRSALARAGECKPARRRRSRRADRRF